MAQIPTDASQYSAILFGTKMSKAVTANLMHRNRKERPTELDVHATAILWQTSCRLWHWVVVIVTLRTSVLSHLLLSCSYLFLPLPFLSFMSFIYVSISFLLSFICHFLVTCCFSFFLLSYFTLCLRSL
jgi:hypothetical protein